MTNSSQIILLKFKSHLLILTFLLFSSAQVFSQTALEMGGVNMGYLTDYLFVFTKGDVDANWQGATKGFVGDVAINGKVASERTSGTVPYAGVITTNDKNLGDWQSIVNDNSGQASASLNKTVLIGQLNQQLENAFLQINALSVTPGYANFDAASLHGINTRNNIADVIVINITSGFNVKDQLEITGDKTDVFFLRWDSDANFSNGYQGQVKFSSGGAIVPRGALAPGNFVHVAGDINSSGGGSAPAIPYPQGPRLSSGSGSLIAGGSDFNGGGFFTGYWLTTGEPTTSDGSYMPYGHTASLSNGVFVGGWYTKTDKFSMTSGTSGVYVKTNIEVPVTWLSVDAKRNNNQVNLFWQTASEENNDFFTVEKSLDNKTFTQIAKVNGAGNSYSVSSYTHSDDNVQGTAYYRIKQTDFNGDYSYSRVMYAEESNAIDVSIYPNPTKGDVTINVNSFAGSKQVEVSDLNGTLIERKTLEASEVYCHFDLDGFRNGIYVVKVLVNDNPVTVSKLVVSR